MNPFQGGLIGEYDDVEEGEAQLAKGQILQKDGESMIRIAREKLAAISEYRPDGKHEVKPFYTQSAKLSREILEEIQIMEESIVEGKKSCRCWSTDGNRGKEKSYLSFL